jgi:hypothetical protein
MERAAKLKFVLFLAALAVSAFILESAYLRAASPSSVKVMVYKVELMKDASDKDPKVVFSNPLGQEVDFAEEAFVLTGEAEIPAGTYKRVRMTVDNGLKLSIEDPSNNPCGMEIFTDRIFPEAEGMAPNSQVHMNFATYDDDGGTWSGSRITHVLLAPVTVSEHRNIEVDFRFKTANTLFCSEDKVGIRSPLAVWAIVVV